MKFFQARAAHLARGRRGEALAVRLLCRMGCVILARNWRTRAGELDIVALDGSTLLFVEVKTRSYRRRDEKFAPAANLSNRQRRRNFAAARWYRKSLGLQRFAARFDLIEVEYRGAFASSLRLWHDYLLPIVPEELP